MRQNVCESPFKFKGNEVRHFLVQRAIPGPVGECLRLNENSSLSQNVSALPGVHTLMTVRLIIMDASKAEVLSSVNLLSTANVEMLTMGRQV